MTAYNCDHLNSMVTGWGIGANTFDALGSGGGLLAVVTGVSMVTPAAELLDFSLVTSSGSPIGRYFQPGENTFPPDGTLWFHPIGGAGNESSDGESANSGIWGSIE